MQASQVNVVDPRSTLIFTMLSRLLSLSDRSSRSAAGRDSLGKGQRSLQGQEASSERGEEQWTTGGTRAKQERKMRNF